MNKQTFALRYSTWAYHGGKLIWRNKEFASEEARARFVETGLASGRIVQVLDMADREELRPAGGGEEA